MYADFLGHFGHGERVEGGCAFFEEFRLTIDQFLSDALDGILPLFDCIDQKFARAHLVADIILLFGFKLSFGDEILVGLVNAKTGNEVVGQGYYPFVANPLNGSIG